RRARADPVHGCRIGSVRRGAAGTCRHRYRAKAGLLPAGDQEPACRRLRSRTAGLVFACGIGGVLMDRDTLAETNFARMAAPYSDAIRPARTQQLRISPNRAAKSNRDTFCGDRAAADRARCDHIRELSKFTLRHRLTAMRMDVPSNERMRRL